MVQVSYCTYCVRALDSTDLNGICVDCWEEISSESLHNITMPAVRYMDYVMKLIKQKLKAKTKMTRIQLGPFSLEALKQLRLHILSENVDYPDLDMQVEIVQTRGQRGGAGVKTWELRFLEPQALDAVFGAALLEDLTSHWDVCGAGKMFGEVFTGWVTGCFKLDASNRRGTTDTALTFTATAGSMSQHGFVWPLARNQPRRAEYQAHLARQVLRINKSRMESNVAIRAAAALGVPTQPEVALLPMPLIRRALVEAGITQGAAAARTAAPDAG